jgi:hypothetical protein
MERIATRSFRACHRCYSKSRLYLPRPAFFAMGISFSPLLEFHRSMTCSKTKTAILSAPKPPRGDRKTVGPSSYHVLGSILSLGDMIVKIWDCIPCSRDRGGLGFGLCTSPKIQFSHSVHFVTAAVADGGYPYPLTVFIMKQDSFVVGTISELFENWDQVVKIVSISRTNVVATLFLEQRSTRYQTTCIFVKGLAHILNAFLKKFVEKLDKVTDILI